MGGFDDYALADGALADGALADGALADGPVVGPTGSVWWATHVPSGRTVAVTELGYGASSDEAFRGRLRATAAALAELGHPNVLPIREVVEGSGPAGSGRVWVVEDWVEGRELGEVLADGPLTPEQSAAVACGVLRGLAAVQGRDVVHGRVSLASVVVTAGGVPRLVGFGFAGMPGRAAADAQADVVAVANVLRHLLGGARSSVGHKKLDKAVERATADPNRRPADAAAFLDTLEKAARSDLGKGWEARTSLAALAVVAPGAAPAPPDGAGEIPVDATQDLAAADTAIAPGPLAAAQVEVDAPPVDDAPADGAHADEAPMVEADALPVDELPEEEGPAGPSDPVDEAPADEAPDVGAPDVGAPDVGAPAGASDPASADAPPVDEAPVVPAPPAHRRRRRDRVRDATVPPAEAAAPTEAPAPTVPPAEAAATDTVASNARPAKTALMPATVPPAKGRRKKAAPEGGAPPEGRSKPAGGDRRRKKDEARAAAPMAATASTRGGRRGRREAQPRGVVQGLAGLIMIVLGLGAAVAVIRDRQADRVSANGRAASPSAEGPTTADVAESEITGTWSMKLVVAESTGFFGTQVGAIAQKIYTIRSDCSTTPCVLRLAVSGTVGEFALRREGDNYILSEAGPQDCIDLATGAVRVPNGGVASVVVHLRPTAATLAPRGDWSASSLSASIVTTFDSTNPECIQGSGVQRSTAVGTRG